ncbi:MAG TPA: hypothetical protein VGE88_07530 [Lysobacter sp.]
MKKIFAAALTLSTLSCAQQPAATRMQAPPTHPLAGFWKDGHCDEDFGLFIAPAGGRLYSISFCGPGGCFAPGTYRPNTSIVDDAEFRVTGANELYVGGKDGSYQRYIRCPAFG